MLQYVTRRGVNVNGGGHKSHTHSQPRYTFAQTISCSYNHSIPFHSYPILFCHVISYHARLAHSPVHTLRHGPLVLVRLMRLRSKASVCRLGVGLLLKWLPRLEVNLIAVHDALGHGEDVGDQAVEQVH
jgi:hypothetical protein